MKLGIDQLLTNHKLRKRLRGKRVGLLGHPASVTAHLQHSLDALQGTNDLQISCGFGPQHGMRGDKQDNMVESEDFVDPQLHIPIFSLYGATRRPSETMLQHCDVVICDVQDIGCRVYTYITTLLYMLQACEQYQKSIWILDRPNPAGRSIEGSILQAGWESFVGADRIIMRHGLTFAEMAQWFIKSQNLDVDITIVPLQDYAPAAPPDYGWPRELAWVNPSPNAASVNMARIFPGSVLLEGTELSEGRGTTIPLEVVGAPDLDFPALLKSMQQLAPQWMRGVYLRPCFFAPTFHKHQGNLCNGFQIHTNHANYQADQFKPYRLFALLLKAIRLADPNYPLWRNHSYEYEVERLAIDLICGGKQLRTWVDEPHADIEDLETQLCADESDWKEQISTCLLYP